MLKTSTTCKVLAALMFLMLLPAMFADVNVALNKTVSINGSQTYVGANVAGCTVQNEPSSTVNDGLFFNEQTCWTFGFAWQGPTNARDTNHYVDIDLGGTFALNAAIVQADDNDTYILQYEDVGGNYHDWWSIGAPGPFGLITRPGGSNHTLEQALPTVEAIGLRFESTGGDSYYSVSEIQAFGTPVPEPGSMILLGSGLLAVARRYRKA